MKTLSLCFLAALPTVAYAQNNAPALLKAEKIMSVRIYQGSRLAATRRYDANGNTLASSEDSFLAETIRTSSLQKFDLENQLLYSKSTHSAMKDTTFWRYQYNEHHQLTTVTDGYTSRKFKELEYNSAGQLLRETSFNATGQVSGETRFKYDNQGHEIEKQVELGGLKGRIVKKDYDSQGRESREEMFDKDKLFFTQLTEYYSTGEKSRITYLESDGPNGVIYTYDPAHRLQSRRHFKLVGQKEVTTGTEEFTYLASGLLNTFSEDIFSSQHIKRTFSYAYN